MNTVTEVLQECSVHGTTVKLPAQQLDRKLYVDVAKHLELIGGKWNRKAAGFVFQQDPTEFLNKIADGEKVNIKKEFQFFATPDDLADRLVRMADIKFNHSILEPSAGQGAIIKAIRRSVKVPIIHYFELMELNQSFLSKIEGAKYISPDFLKMPLPEIFDRIIANPPFSKNQDIDHIYKMWDCLAKGGRIVTIASKHWQFASGKKEEAFKEWLDEKNVYPEDLPSGEFKESGTNISTCILVIDKP